MVVREGYCVHFNGLTNKCCAAGVEYDTVRQRHELMVIERDGSTIHSTRSYPCLTDQNHVGATCEKSQFLTAEQIAEADAEAERRTGLPKQDRSWCCEAPIDQSQVIQAGRYKGHGSRFCSKCRRCLFMV